MLDVSHHQAQTLVTAAELADRLKVSRATVKRWALAGKITPAMKLPGETGAYLFPSDTQRPEVAA